MVNDDPTRVEVGRLASSDRAQLVLIGAVLAAIAILGLTTVINTVLFTEDITASIDESGSVAAEEYDLEARTAAASIVLRLNHRTRNVTATELNATIRGNLTDYRQIRQELTATSRDVLLDIEFDNGSAGTVHGRRIVQVGDGNFTSDDSTTDWEPVPGGDTVTVGRLLMNVNVEKTSDSTPFVMNVTSVPTGRHVVFEMKNDNSSGVGNLTVDYNRSWTATSLSDRCEPAGRRAVLDFGQGDAYTDDCGFASFTELQQPLDVAFENGDEIVGKYDIALNESTSSVGPGGDYETCDTSVDADQPCVSPVVWQADVDLSYRTDRIEYGKEYNVSVYRRGP